MLLQLKNSALQVNSEDAARGGRHTSTKNICRSSRPKQTKRKASGGSALALRSAAQHATSSAAAQCTAAAAAAAAGTGTVELASEADLSTSVPAHPAAGPEDAGCPVEAVPADDGAAPREGEKPRLLVLMGLPGSGKTWLAERLQQVGWQVVSQDVLKSRVKCEEAARRHLAQGHDLVIDRCPAAPCACDMGLATL